MSAVPPEKVALVRALYAEGVAVSRILRESGMCSRALYAAIDGKLADGGGARPQPLPRRLRGRRTEREARVAVVARLWRAAERQVRDIETRLASETREPGDCERDARSLAVLIKTLRELHALDGARPRGESKAEANDDTVRDLDEFRRELARKIDRLAAEPPLAGDCGSRSR